VPVALRVEKPTTDVESGGSEDGAPESTSDEEFGLQDGRAHHTNLQYSLPDLRPFIMPGSGENADPLSIDYLIVHLEELLYAEEADARNFYDLIRGRRRLGLKLLAKLRLQLDWAVYNEIDFEEMDLDRNVASSSRRVRRGKKARDVE